MQMQLLAPIESIGAEEKRKSEMGFLNGLLTHFTPEEVMMMVVHLGKRGALKTGEKCHSLYRYLGTAGDDVLAEVNRRRPGSATAEPVHPPTTETFLPEVRDMAARQFEGDISPTEQERLVSEFIAREYPHGFLPPLRVVRSLVAIEWFKNRSSPPCRIAS
jgi:hypothetical protein